MKERPILFSAPMVRAILAGTKTQTRRVMKNQPQWSTAYQPAGWRWEENGGGLYKWPNHETFALALAERAECPYGKPGDRLWVREPWRHTASSLEEARAITEDICSGTAVDYRATYIEQCRRELGFSQEDAELADSFEHWRRAIHMPRWASRILLEVLAVRVEQLQAISIEDAKAEGAWPDDSVVGDCVSYFGIDPFEVNPIRAFQMVWERIHSPTNWHTNPWVWVIEFKRVQA